MVELISILTQIFYNIVAHLFPFNKTFREVVPQLDHSVNALWVKTEIHLLCICSLGCWNKRVLEWWGSSLSYNFETVSSHFLWSHMLFWKPEKELDPLVRKNSIEYCMCIHVYIYKTPLPKEASFTSIQPMQLHSLLFRSFKCLVYYSGVVILNS
jgi:hypothetical protein